MRSDLRAGMGCVGSTECKRIGEVGLVRLCRAKVIV